MNLRDNPSVDVRLRCYAGSPKMKPPRYVGVTENISRVGILVLWDREQADPPHVGELLTIDLELPANHTFGRKCMHCETTAVRVSSGEGSAARVALNIDRMEFRDWILNGSRNGNNGNGHWTV
jgi:hypothetical protein